MTSTISDDALSSGALFRLVALLILIIVATCLWVYLWNIIRRLPDLWPNDLCSSADKQSLPLPPKISHGIRETLSHFFSKDAPFFLLAQSRIHGSIFRLPFGPKRGVIVVGDYQAARDILNSPEVTKPWQSYKLFDRVAGGQTFFVSEGQRWKHVRKATASAFAPAHVERIKDVVRSNVDRLIREVIDPAATSGESFDVALNMQFTTVRVICEAGFEYSISDDEIRDLLESFRLTYREYSQTSALAPWRIFLPFLFSEARMAKRASSWLRSFAQRMLDSYRSKDSNKVGGTTVIAAIAHDAEYASDEERVSDIVVYLAGGYDTTAYTLSWALLELARNPAEQDNLCCDFAKKEGGNSDSLNLVVKEVLRLHPTAALGSVRFMTKDMKAGGYLLPKGSFVNVPYFVVHRNQTVFGEDADSFRPRRWVGKDAPPSASIIPFASGRRNCVGQAMANAELMVILETLCSKFELSVDDEGTYDYFVTWKTNGTSLFAKRR